MELNSQHSVEELSLHVANFHDAKSAYKYYAFSPWVNALYKFIPGKIDRKQAYQVHRTTIYFYGVPVCFTCVIFLCFIN